MKMQSIIDLLKYRLSIRAKMICQTKKHNEIVLKRLYSNIYFHCKRNLVFHCTLRDKFNFECKDDVNSTTSLIKLLLLNS